MVKFDALALGGVGAMVFGLALNADFNNARWSNGGVFVVSAMAQMPVDGCTTALIPGRVDGAEYYKCDNGEHYRDIGGDFVKVDLNGDPVAEAESSNSAPQNGNTTAPALPAAKPDFKTAPKN